MGLNCNTMKANKTIDKIETVTVRHGNCSTKFCMRPKMVVVGFFDRFVTNG